jgi:hypothetical protein
MFVAPKLAFDCTRYRNSVVISNYQFYSTEESRDQSPQRNTQEMNGVIDADGPPPEMPARLVNDLVNSARKLTKTRNVELKIFAMFTDTKQKSPSMYIPTVSGLSRRWGMGGSLSWCPNILDVEFLGVLNCNDNVCRM